MRKFKFDRKTVIELPPKRRVIKFGGRKIRYLAFPYVQFAKCDVDYLKVCCSTTPVVKDTPIMPVILPNMQDVFTYCLGDETDFSKYSLENLIHVFWETTFRATLKVTELMSSDQELKIDGKKITTYDQWENLSKDDHVGLTYDYTGYPLQFFDQAEDKFTFEQFMNEVYW